MVWSAVMAGESVHVCRVTRIVKRLARWIINAVSGFRTALREQQPPKQLDSASEIDEVNNDVVRLDHLAALDHARGAYADAAPLYERALQIREATLGTAHPDIARTLHNLARLYREQGAHARAAPLYERALRMYETTVRGDDRRVATSLHNLATVYHAQGEVSRAVPFCERALRMREAVLGTDHPDVATTLNDLATLYLDLGMYGRAMPLYERALHIRHVALGTKPAEMAAAMDHLALSYFAQGAFDVAAPLFERALHVREMSLGTDHLDVARSLENLGLVYRARGVYKEAARLCDRALHIRETSLGALHPEVARSLNNRALIHQAQGEYAQAAPLAERALRIREKVLGAVHREVAASLNNLAAVHLAQGAYTQAASLLERALHIDEATLGAEHPEVALSLNNLAVVLQAQAAYVKAAPLLERALLIHEAALGTEHPALATFLDNLATLYRDQSKYADATALCKRALAIREVALRSEHPDVATSLNNLAVLYQAGGTYAEAEPLLERALRMYVAAFGSEHPDSLATLHNLAILYWATGDLARALHYFKHAVAMRERLSELTLATLPEARRRQFVQASQAETEILFSFHAHAAPNNAGALALAWTSILRRRGRVLAEAVREQTTIRDNGPPGLQSEIDALQALRAELAMRRHSNPAATQKAELAALASKIAQSELELTRKIAPLRSETAPPTIESIQVALPDRTVLVEFVRYRRFVPDGWPQRWREFRYIAYVLPRDGSPQYVALGDAEPIEAAVTAALAALMNPASDTRDVRSMSDDPKGVAHDLLRALDELVFAPIRRHLGPANHFVLSLDAALHHVPFAALVDENGRYLVERMLISYVTSGQDLLRTDAREPARAKPLVVAAPSYSGRFAHLPGAASEADAIRKHFPDIEIHLGAYATKEKLTAARGPSFVHIATHGFFRTARASASSRAIRCWYDDGDVLTTRSVPYSVDDRVEIEDALDDSGLVFAGEDDAQCILTAREISNIDLRGTQLIVLSACETGMGEVHRSEGLYGLRRALVIAGAQTQVVSLWRIDDKATSELMDGYYSALRRGMGRTEALRHAQIQLLRDGQHAHPFYWAAFLPIGNEQALREQSSA